MGSQASVQQKSHLETFDIYDQLLQKYKFYQNTVNEIKGRQDSNSQQQQGKLMVSKVNLQQTISDSLKRQKQFLDNFKIYNLFMGSSNSGKSTLINALVGFELIPIDCEVLKDIIIEVQHSEDIIHNYVRVHLKQIDINDFQQEEIYNCPAFELKEFFMTKDLFSIQVITFQVNSYFHNQFNQQLRNHIVLVDIPGFQSIGETKAEIKKFLTKIEQFYSLNQNTEETLILSTWVLDFAASKQGGEPHLIYLMEKLKNQLSDSNGQELISSIFMQSQDNEWIINSQDEEEKIKESILMMQSRVRNSLKDITVLLNKCDLPKEIGIQSQLTVKKIMEMAKQYQCDPRIFRISAKEALTFNILSYARSKIKNKYMLTQSLTQSDFKKKADIFIASQDFDYFLKYLNNLIQDKLQNIMFPIQKQFEQNLELLHLLDEDVSIILTERELKIIQRLKEEGFENRYKNFTYIAEMIISNWNLDQNKIETIKLTKQLKLKQNLCKQFLQSSIIKFEELNEVFKNEIFKQHEEIYMFIRKEEETKFSQQSQFLILTNEPWYLKGVRQILTQHSNITAFQNFLTQIRKIESLDIKTLNQGNLFIQEDQSLQTSVIKFGLNLFRINLNENSIKKDLINESIDFWAQNYNQLKQDLQKSYENLFKQQLEILYVYLSNLSNI